MGRADPSTPSTALTRDPEALASRRHDLLIIGGGIYGAVAAWDAAQRGLRVALVEAHDFGSGTSWNSLKTIHGGLRHLQRAEVGLLRESVRERRALLRIAPRLVQPLPFLVPTYGHGLKGREALAVAMLLNQALSLDRNRGLAPASRLPGFRLLGRQALRNALPGVPEAGLKGGVLWYDAQVSNSERLLLAFLHAAASAGAVLLNQAEITGVRRDGKRVVGAEVVDRESGTRLPIDASVVLNAAGPAAEGIWRLAEISRPAVPLRLAINLVLRRRIVDHVAVGARSEGNYLFIVPWRDRSIAGTAYAAPELEPQVLAESLMERLQQAFPWADLSMDDVALIHAGRVPGDERKLSATSQLIDHERSDGVSGLITAFGAKYTTARAVAERAVDLAFRKLARPTPRCATHEILLPEARAPEGVLEDQVKRALREEMARGLDDVILRRLELGATGRPHTSVLDRVARAVAHEQGWGAGRLETERATLEGRWPTRSDAPSATGHVQPRQGASATSAMTGELQ
jgi:glycerol-3-phosphate dehydrogenase